MEVEIQRRNGTKFIVLVDKEDYDKYKKYGWVIDVTKGYMRVRVSYINGKKSESLSRLIIGCKNGKEKVDHINRNTLDNRRCNLRIVSSHDNCLNTDRSKFASKYYGVAYCKNQKKLKWRAGFSHNQYKMNKMFSTEIEAAKQFNVWAKKYIGGNCLLNIIN